MYMYTKTFLPCLIKAWVRPSKKKKKDGEIGKAKLNETEHCEIEKVK